MKLSKIIQNTKYNELINFEDVEITGISYNSKTVEKGNLFVCLKGEHTDERCRCFFDPKKTGYKCSTDSRF